MNLALNPFGKGKKPENIEVIVTESDNKINRTVAMYAHYLSLDNRCDKINTIELDILNPDEIKSFVSTVAALEIPHEGGLYPGRFVNRLLKESMSLGYDKFVLDTRKGHRFSWLCNGFEGIELVVRGDIGVQLGYDVKGSNIIVYGDCGYCLGVGAENSEFTVTGKSSNVGIGAKHCTFNLGGEVNDIAGGSVHSTFIVNSLVPRQGFIERTNCCTFKTSASDLYYYLKKIVNPNLNRSPKFVYTGKRRLFE
ncbi:hypothetical protein KY330_05810 [Candidatus Woesearchaeota archaeon]|nr:hypothetical protein [Candidatus Woesearchaeota archaeon]